MESRKSFNSCPAYISKHDSTRQKQMIFLMTPNDEKEERWHYLAVKKLSALLHRVTPKNKVDFYCLNCLHKMKSSLMKNYLKIKIFVEL